MTRSTPGPEETDDEALVWLAEVLRAGAGPAVPSAPPAEPLRSQLEEPLRSRLEEPLRSRLEEPLRSRLEERIARLRPDVKPPGDLVARPCELPAPAWHLAALWQVLGSGRDDESAMVRSAYHARWLLHFLRPGDPRHVPRASVVIPVYNRAPMAAEAVASCLEQTHPAVEVVVVDDGSCDDLESALEPFRQRIVFHRQPNRGVSAARNAGIRLATGEFLSFLDSDNLLDPDAIEILVGLFACVSDAELAYCHPHDYEGPGAEWRRSERIAPTGEAGCPTTDFTTAGIRRYPFNNLGVLVPRWVTLEIGGFDERLRRSEDARFWFQLALRGTKVLGLQRTMNTRRLTPDGLSMDWKEHDDSFCGAPLLNLADLLRSPRHWPHVAAYLQRLRGARRWEAISTSRDPLVEELRGKLLEEIGRLDERGRSVGLSAKPLLRVCASRAKQAAKRGLVPDGGRDLFHFRFVAAIGRAIATASAPGLRDLDFWLDAGAPPRENQAAILAVLEEVNASTFRTQPLCPLVELPALTERWPRHPWRRRWRGLALLAPWIGEAHARRVLALL